MASKLTKLLRDEYYKGMDQGWQAFAIVALLAGYNVYEKYMTEETYRKFAVAWESECGRLFRDECRSDPKNAAEALLYYANEVRRKMGLEGFDD